MSTSEQVIDKVKLTQTIFLNLTQDFYKILKWDNRKYQIYFNFQQFEFLYVLLDAANLQSLCSIKFNLDPIFQN